MDVYQIIEDTIPTLIELIVDQSGSMGICQVETVEGINAYIKEQEDKHQDDPMIGLTFFDSIGWPERTTRMNNLFHKPLSKVTPLKMNDFRPNGGTPLYDAVGTKIKNIEKKISKMDVKPNVLLIIVTDGGNTDHHGYSSEDVKEMITQKQEDGWSVVYMGANQDAWAVGNTFGISKGNAMSYSTENMENTFANLSRSTVAYATASSTSGADGYVTRNFFSDAGLTEKDFSK